MGFAPVDVVIEVYSNILCNLILAGSFPVEYEVKPVEGVF